MIATLDSWGFSVFFFFLPTTACEKSILNFKNWMLSNKPLAFDSPNLNYYVLVVSWSYYKYLKGSIYHWDTVYQQRWISCASKGQWFRCINMWVGNSLCIDLNIIAVMTNRGCGKVSVAVNPDMVWSLTQVQSFHLVLLEICEKAYHTAVNPLCVALSLSTLYLLPALSHQLWGGLNKRCGAVARHW